MILPLTLPPQPSPDAPVLPPALARLGSSELFLLELQGELQVSGDKHGQLVGRLSIDEDGKVRPESAFSLSLPTHPAILAPCRYL
jgi:chromosome transmission fidelity protein 8